MAPCLCAHPKGDMPTQRASRVARVAGGLWRALALVDGPATSCSTRPQASLPLSQETEEEEEEAVVVLTSGRIAIAQWEVRVLGPIHLRATAIRHSIQPSTRRLAAPLRHNTTPARYALYFPRFHSKSLSCTHYSS